MPITLMWRNFPKKAEPALSEYSKMRKMKTMMVIIERSVSGVLVKGNLWVVKKCLLIKQRLLKKPTDKKNKADNEKSLILSLQDLSFFGKKIVASK